MEDRDKFSPVQQRQIARMLIEAFNEIDYGESLASEIQSDVMVALSEKIADYNGVRKAADFDLEAGVETEFLTLPAKS